MTGPLREKLMPAKTRQDGAPPGRTLESCPFKVAALAFLSALALGLTLLPAASSAAERQLADQPVDPALSMPANVLLSLSVEFPTGNVHAHNDETAGTGCPGRITVGADDYQSVCYFEPAVRAARVNAANASNPTHLARASMPYIGYFDPFKCYLYNNAAGYFYPVGNTAGFSPVHHYSAQPATSTAACSSQWSGNFLNWATMQTIDLFRWAMTGGDRQIDTATLTVLQKARHDGMGNGNNLAPTKVVGQTHFDIPVVAPATVSPYASAELFLRTTGLNTNVEVSTTADFAAPVSMNVGVRVCDAAHPESITTCTPYGSSLKPTGLVQENASQVRFAAFGYLMDSDFMRDGGVMRARMKFVGPTRPELSADGLATNAAAEWRADNGIYIENPDSADAAATSALVPGNTIASSGVIQYLNRFGRLRGYKNHDPVGELYYEGLRYLRNIGPTPEYTNLALTAGSAADKIDGFPVITSWDDPLAPPPGFETAEEWCPRNFILGIADTNSHRDKRLPGNTDSDDESAAEPSNPDGAYNVVTLLNQIIASELANEGVQLLKPDNVTPLAAGTAGVYLKNSAYPAALAYYANTRDIRPDSAAIHTHGRQSVKTFYADVREPGSWGYGFSRSDARRRSQLWLAAKYGGFNDVNGNGVLDSGDVFADLNGDGVVDIRDAWDGNGDLLPDNYFEVSSADSLVDGLKAAFVAIRSELASNVTAAISTRSRELQAGNALYKVNYDPGYWSGELAASEYQGFDSSTGLITATHVWSAAEKLAATDWSSRRIVTLQRASATAAAGTAVPFRWTELTDWQRASLNDNVAVLEFLRGRNDNPSLRRRLRTAVSGGAVSPAALGDIVDSAPRLVAAPAQTLSEQYNPGYTAHIAAYKERLPLLYVGANDGMVHAFDARIDHDDGGSEVFAYIPSSLFAGQTSPSRDGLLALSERGYLHRYYVNSSPVAAEVDFARTGGATTTGDWRTVLVGGLGKGGRLYYALDVTDPEAFTTEAAVAGKVLWEFSDPTMGFTYGEPQIVKTRRWGWVALLTSGYNNTAANGSTGAGAGYLYVVNVRTGELLQRISTGSGSDSQPSGLAQVTGYVPDATDGTVTEVYGGDLDGKVWRFDFSSATAAVPTPTLLATLSGPVSAQPITSAPIIRAAPITRDRYVFIGTGALLGQRDLFDSSQQTFYALRDGSRSAPWISATGGAPTFPITRARMVANADLLTPITPDPTRPGGWYHDLTVAAERVVIEPQDTDLGKISWLSSAPNVGALCTGSPQSRFYLASFETGQSQIFDQTSPTPTLVTSFDPGRTAVGLRLVRVGGNLKGLVSGRDQSLTLTQDYLRMLTPRTMNWREITEPGF